MTSFKNFANDGSVDDGISKETSSVRNNKDQMSRVGSRIEKLWATDFERCKTREDYMKYISKYEKYDSNKFISQARDKIELIDAEELAGIDRKNMVKNENNSASNTIDSSKNIGRHSKARAIKIGFKALVCLVIIAGIVGFSYYRYQHNQIEPIPKPPIVNDSSKTATVDPYTEVNQCVADTNMGSDIITEQGNDEREEVSQHEPVYVLCTACGQSGHCPVCFGVGRCGGCGGSGQIFYFSGGEGGLTDCGACGGSGACGGCEGTGLCQLCNGKGKCNLEDYS